MNCAREQSILENEKNNKINALSARTPVQHDSYNDSKADGSPTKSLGAAQSSSRTGTLIDTIGMKSVDELITIHAKTHYYQHASKAKTTHLSQSQLFCSQLSSTNTSSMKRFPHSLAFQDDNKHSQPIDVMSDYESRLINKEALRNPLGEPEIDEDTPTGLRRRQLCFNLGNPYKKNTLKVNSTLRCFLGTIILHTLIATTSKQYLSRWSSRWSSNVEGAAL